MVRDRNRQREEARGCAFARVPDGPCRDTRPGRTPRARLAEYGRRDSQGQLRRRTRSPEHLTLFRERPAPGPDDRTWLSTGPRHPAETRARPGKPAASILPPGRNPSRLDPASAGRGRSRYSRLARRSSGRPAPARSAMTATPLSRAAQRLNAPSRPDKAQDARHRGPGAAQPRHATGTGDRDQWPSRPASHSRSFDQRERPEALRTAMAMALRCPVSTTSFLPRVMPV
jgi:hypothetical protein